MAIASKFIREYDNGQEFFLKRYAWLWERDMGQPCHVPEHLQIVPRHQGRIEGGLGEAPAFPAHGFLAPCGQGEKLAYGVG